MWFVIICRMILKKMVNNNDIFSSKGPLFKEVFDFNG